MFRISNRSWNNRSACLRECLIIELIGLAIYSYEHFELIAIYIASEYRRGDYRKSGIRSGILFNGGIVDKLLNRVSHISLKVRQLRCFKWLELRIPFQW